jgi:hypothetical protein
MDINKKENIRKKILDLVKVYSDLNFSEKNLNVYKFYLYFSYENRLK